MIKLKDMLNKDVTLGKVYTDKDKPPFQVKEEKLDEALKKISQKSRFGAIEIRHGEEPTAPGYDPMYIIDVKIGGNFVAAILNPFLNIDLISDKSICSIFSLSG